MVRRSVDVIIISTTSGPLNAIPELPSKDLHLGKDTSFSISQAEPTEAFNTQSNFARLKCEMGMIIVVFSVREFCQAMEIRPAVRAAPSVCEPLLPQVKCAVRLQWR